MNFKKSYEVVKKYVALLKLVILNSMNTNLKREVKLMNYGTLRTKNTDKCWKLGKCVTGKDAV